MSAETGQVMWEMPDMTVYIAVAGVHRLLSEARVKTKQEGLQEVFVQVREKGTVQWLHTAYRVRDRKVWANGVLDTYEWSKIRKGLRCISTSHMIKVSGKTGEKNRGHVMVTYPWKFHL